MEITKTGKFITDFYGSAPAMGAENILKTWIEDKQDKSILSWSEQIAKKGQTAIQALETNLSILHRDDDGFPVLGSWMMRRCLVVTGQTIFNAQKNKSHPKKDLIPMAFQLVEPYLIHMYTATDNIRIEKPQGIITYTVTTKKGSFFKAYERIRAGASFTVSVTIDDEIMQMEHIEKVFAKAGAIGVGAFRERYGKFVWVD
jgi:hypothetical protein